MKGFNRKRSEGSDGVMKKNLKLKVRKLDPVNTTCYVQILGTGMDTQDTSPSVLLFFDQQRIIFNAGEGLQRFCTEHKIKLSKIDHMLLTRVCSQTAGGLPGLLLTLAGIGEEGMSVNIWGPSDFTYMVDAMRSFIPNAAMVHCHSFGKTTKGDCPIFTDPIVLIDDELVKISAILLHPRFSMQQSMDKGVDSLIPGTNPFSDFGSSMRKAPSKPGDIAVVYVCELPDIKGKFDPSKATSLGLKPGPKYHELQLGNPVKSDTSDIIIHPIDVLGPSIPGPIVLLVDCPTPSHFSELLSTQSLNGYYPNITNHQSHETSKSVTCIIHLGPCSITNNSDYQNWMRQFVGAKHIMAGHQMENITVPILRSSVRIAGRLNYVCPYLFPSPRIISQPKIMNSHPGFNSSNKDSSSYECILAENLLKFQLRPYSQIGLDRSSIPCLQTSSELISELLSEIPEIQNASKHVTRLWHCSSVDKTITLPFDNNGNGNTSTLNDTECQTHLPSCLENISREDMEIVLLGTGSSQPSKYRNVTSILVNLFSKGTMILDCGEGTLGQLKRRFGLEGADDAVKALRLIWISHIHADHHTGLARILSLRRDLLRDLPHEPLIVVGPRPLQRFLDAYSRLEDLNMQFLDCSHIVDVSWITLADVKDTDSQGSGESIEGCTILAKCNNQMASFSKYPGSPVDTVMALPILSKLKNVLHDAGLEVMYSVPVVHCPHAFGIVLKASERMNIVCKVIPGWKLVYSGDTRPCQALVDASHDATVLIHEATFEDGMEKEAQVKNHSTTLEAIEVGTAADAYRIILTHFSQRYPKIPIFDDTHMSKTCIGFDLMSVNAADLPVLPKVLPHLKLLFKDQNEKSLPDDTNTEF